MDRPASMDRGSSQDRMGTTPDGTIGQDTGCANQTSGAEALPLDLYMMMDTSLSMTEAATNGVSKWDAVRTAMMAFFNDSQSAGIGVGLAYFPVVSSSLPATCTADSDCTADTCDRRQACVRTNTVSTASPSGFCANTAACASNQTCALLEDCGTPLTNYCVSGGTAEPCAAGCTAEAGYCHTRDSCDPAVYATPVVPIATLPGAATALQASLSAHSPDGYTPTSAALNGAIMLAKQQAGANPTHKVAIVLVTDGLPGGFTDLYNSAGALVTGIPRPECNPLDIPSIAAIASTAATGTPSIPTFVIGVFSPSEASTVQPKLDMLATGGGTGAAVVINTGQDVNVALQAALKQIRTTEIACSYTIPASSGGAFDFNTVQVTFNDGAGNITTLPYLKNVGSCTNNPNGWYFDVDQSVPGAAPPTSIILCATGCTQFQSISTGSLKTVIGCMVQIPG